MTITAPLHCIICRHPAQEWSGGKIQIHTFSICLTSARTVASGKGALRHFPLVQTLPALSQMPRFCMLPFAVLPFDPHPICAWSLDPRQFRRGHEDVQIRRGLEPVEGEGAAGEHDPLPVREAEVSQRGQFLLQHIILPTK